MIKINLLAERKQPKAKAAPTIRFENLAGAKNLVLAGVLVIGVAVAGLWSWQTTRSLDDWNAKHRAADAELERLKEIRAKGEEYKKRKELLARKIDLITDLKKKQEVPVHILDQLSKNLPDFLWLDRMSAENNAISIAGKATTYNAVSNYYKNLTSSGYFRNVTLGRTYEVREGVAFSVTCEFVSPQDAAEPEETAG